MARQRKITRYIRRRVNRRNNRRYRRRYARLGSYRHGHRFCRWETTDRSISLEAGSSPNQRFGAYTFSLNQVQNVSEFENLYDQFKITGVKLYFNWTPFTGAAVVPSNALAPVLQYFRDYDDDSTPNEGIMKSRANIKQIRLTPNRQHTVFLRPAVLNSVYESALATGYAPKFRQRLDMSDDPVKHFGLKWWLKGVDSLNCGAVNVRVKYYFTCYGQR